MASDPVLVVHSEFRYRSHADCAFVRGGFRLSSGLRHSNRARADTDALRVAITNAASAISRDKIFPIDLFLR